ncbi:hypothetical protein [Herbaspirillum huttiense]|uniref:hypothetical protein n=1 Tax=Herbaspirillum huttiense TaxID=863372 RepID=UPI0039B00518
MTATGVLEGSQWMSETEPGLAADDDRRNHYAELTVLIEDMLRRIRLHLLKALAEKRPARGMVELLDFYLSERVRRCSGTRCPLMVMGSAAPSAALSARERFASGLAEIKALLAEVLARMGVNHPGQLADSLMAEVLGSILLARILDRETAHALMQECARQIKLRLGVADVQAQQQDGGGRPLPSASGT